MAELLPEDIETREEFIKLLRRMRQASGYTQVQLGEMIGSYRANIAKMETFQTRSDIRLGTLQRYARAVGCKVVLMLEEIEESETGT